LIFRLKDFIIEVDVCTTKEFYYDLPKIIDNCQCDGCYNYFLAANDFPKKVKLFFKKLGVDILKAAEIITWHSENNGMTLHYGGFYHVYGKLIGRNDSQKNKNMFYCITKNYLVAFTDMVSLPEKNFTESVIQIEIDFYGVPWKLNKKNMY